MKRYVAAVAAVFIAPTLCYCFCLIPRIHVYATATRLGMRFLSEFLGTSKSKGKAVTELCALLDRPPDQTEEVILT